MCSIIGVGERLHKVLGQVDLGTLDSGERSLPFGLLVEETREGEKQSTLRVKDFEVKIVKRNVSQLSFTAT